MSFLGGDCVRGESAGGGSGGSSGGYEDRKIAVRRQRKPLMAHQAEDQAEEFPLRTPSEMVYYEDLPQAATVPVRRDRLRVAQSQVAQVQEGH